jgi:SAM-dependent methyltransferase
VADRVSVEIASAKQLSGRFDLIAFFDCLHDLGDPVGALQSAKQHLSDRGTILLVEPMAGDRVEDNLNPVGAAYYGFSTFALHAELAGTGDCARTGCAGRRGTDAGGRDEGGLDDGLICPIRVEVSQQ